MTNSFHYLSTSIGRKQTVAVTGILLIGYVIVHLAGNLLIFLGPEVFNGYAKKLAGLRPGLYVVEFGLLWIFIVHMYVTALLVLGNIKARGASYKMIRPKGHRSLATRLMPYTGTIILAFVIYHLIDFTFIDHEGPRSILADGKSYGLYGVIYNSFSDPMHSTIYIIAMITLGFHLAHAVESFFQTFGFDQISNQSGIKGISNSFAIIVTLAYCSIPVYILVNNAIR